MQGAEKISQRRSWDEIWIFRGTLQLIPLDPQIAFLCAVPNLDNPQFMK